MAGNRPVLNGQPVPSCDAGTFVYFGPSVKSRGHLAVEWLDEKAYLAIYEPGPQRLMGNLLGAGAFAYPVKVPRAVYPDAIGRNWNDGRSKGPGRSDDVRGIFAPRLAAGALDGTRHRYRGQATRDQGRGG